MIAKFSEISGDNLAALLAFIHGDENRVAIPHHEDRLMVIRIKAINPVDQGDETSYNLTLDIVEWFRKGTAPELYRVDPKFFLKAYEIIGQDRLVKSISADKPQVDTTKYPPISVGTQVTTTKPNMSLIGEWTHESLVLRKWGIQGVVETYHDSHGLCYVVRHEDGTVGPYDPSELEIVS